MGSFVFILVARWHVLQLGRVRHEMAHYFQEMCAGAADAGTEAGPVSLGTSRSQQFPLGRMLKGVLGGPGLIRPALGFYKQRGRVFTCGFT